MGNTRRIVLTRRPDDLEDFLCGKDGLGFKKKENDKFAWNDEIVLDERHPQDDRGPYYVMLLIYPRSVEAIAQKLEEVYKKLEERYKALKKSATA